MKKILCTFTLVASSLALAGAASAQSAQIAVFPSLDTSIRIEVGQGQARDNQELSDRVHRLERAVFDLQQRLYSGAPSQGWFCSTDSNFNKTYTGSGASRGEAEAAAKGACQADVNGMFCQNEVKCDRK